MAGQRGSGANAGMIARQASMQGAQNQQTAAGQAALMGANQQLAGQQQMANIAGQQVGQQQNATNALQQGGMNMYGQMSNNINNQNAINAGVAQQNQNATNQLIGNIVGGAGAAMMMGGGGAAAPGASAATSGGGTVGAFGSPKMLAEGGTVSSGSTGIIDTIKNAFTEEPPKQGKPIKPLDQDKTKGFIKGGNFAKGGPVSKVGQHFHGMTPMPQIAMAEGGKVPAMVSPGEKYLSPQAVDKVAQGADPMAEGETIPGKAKVKGAKNSYANDTVPKTLDEGGIVLPRSVTQSKNPHWAAHKFVSQIMAKNGQGLPKKAK
jgi:hypothetical protein